MFALSLLDFGPYQIYEINKTRGLMENLYHVLLWLSGLFFVVIVGAMIHLAVKQRKQSTAWVVVPALLLLLVLAWGYYIYRDKNQGQEPKKEPQQVSVVTDPVQRGKLVFERKGCIACHSLDGTPRVGPSLKGRFGTQVVLADGATVLIDEAYIRESLEKPQAKIVKGYPPSMPVFQGMLTESEFDALIALIKSLK